jgi:UDP-3-O-[3-hydroxymyristoyl] glucosamine N-acyltransferase
VHSVSHSVSDLLKWTGGRLANEASLKRPLAEIRLGSVSSLKGSRPDQVAFFFSAAYQEEIPFVQSGALVTGEPFVEPIQKSGLPIWQQTAIIACKDPYLAMAQISEKFAAYLSSTSHVPGLTPRESKREIHETAIVDPSAKLGEDVVIGPFCVVEKDAQIGARSILYKGCFLGPGSRLGEDCVLFPNVSVYEWCELGSRVRVHAGCVIGADGFGYAPRIENGHVKEQIKIHHLGKVVIGDDVELGAATTVDRGTLSDTRIGRGVKIDNNVQIGHNARIGEGSIICANAAMAGSSIIGKFVYMGGYSAINNGVIVADETRVGPGCMVSSDITEKGEFLGFPQRPAKDYFRIHILMSRLLKDSKKNLKQKD